MASCRPPRGKSFYVARPLIEERTDKPLDYTYFSQTLLPNYVNEHGDDWDVVYDDRGHFVEPHTERVIGLGTLNVRGYLSRIDQLKFEEADFAPASVDTYGPDGSFGAILYVEKEGFMPLFERVKLAKRYDIAIMSCKGMSVTAARELVDRICCESVPLLVLHDFDSRRDHHQGHAAERHPALHATAGRPLSSTSDCTTRHRRACRPSPTTPPSATSGLAEAGLDRTRIDFLRSSGSS